MGTKLENAVNLLVVKSPKLSALNDWGACLKAQAVLKDNNAKTETDFQKLQNSMDRMVNDLDTLESIKKTMLEHDHLFKQQVKELHRLYGVQKMLMHELKYKVIEPAQTSVANGYIHEKTRGTCSEENLIKPVCFDLERCAQEPNTADQKQGETRHTRAKGSSNRDEDEVEIELTLSIGNPRNSNRRMNTKYEQPHCNVDLLLCSNSISNHFLPRHLNGLSDREESSPSREDCSETVVTSDQVRQRPHWLLQSLSSHKTR